MHRSLFRLVHQENSRLCLLVVLLLLLLYSFILLGRLRYLYVFRSESFISRRSGEEGTVAAARAATLAAKGDEVDSRWAVELYNLSDDYKGSELECVQTKTIPPTTVCLFSSDRDIYISHDIAATGQWEHHIVVEVLDVLRRDPDVLFIDIGANIGYYTMLAASSGHRVVAVEPNMDSIHRLHRAAQIEHVTDKIVVLHNAVAERRTMATLRLAGDNQGDTRIELVVKECTGACPPTVSAIILDDIATTITDVMKSASRSSRVVIKIDVQGYEHRLFLRQPNIFFDSLNITHIFMEWHVMKQHQEPEKVDSSHRDLASRLFPSAPEDRGLVINMMSFLYRRNFHPYALDLAGGYALDPLTWSLWPDDVVWRPAAGADLKLQLLRHHYRNWPL